MGMGSKEVGMERGGGGVSGGVDINRGCQAGHAPVQIMSRGVYISILSPFGRHNDYVFFPHPAKIRGKSHLNKKRFDYFPQAREIQF